MRLDTKLLLLFVAVSLLFAGVISVSSRRAVDAVLLSNLENAARTHAADVGRSLPVGLKNGNEAILRTYLQGCVGAFGASYAAALDADGRVLDAQGDSSATRARGHRFAAWSKDSPLPRSAETSFGGRPVLEFVLPVAGGGLLLGYQLDEARRTERQIAVKIFLFTGSAGALALALLMLVLRGLLAPVRRLTSGVEKISRGEYGTVVDVNTADEVGDLARHFNEMSSELARTTVSKEYLTGILENLLDGVFVVDGEGSLRTVNPSLLRMLGYREPDLIGRSASRLFEPGKDPGGEAIHNAELFLVRSGGEKIPVLFSSSPLPAAGGGAKWMVCAARDVAELRRKDAALKERETLLRQSDKLSALGRLAAGIAHEINNPLGSILGFAQAVLSRLKPDDALTPPLRGIEEEALRSRALVTSLLSFSRQNKPASEEFDLGAAVHGTLAMLEAQARVRRVEIVRELGAGILARGDRGQIQQVIMNLSSNALDAMPSGGRLTIRAGAEAEGGRIFLEVEDDGTGIPDDIRGKIFDPFFTTKELGKGTGLGLSLVHEIVARHQGTVEVRPAPVRGALFRVVLPGARTS